MFSRVPAGGMGARLPQGLRDRALTALPRVRGAGWEDREGAQNPGAVAILPQSSSAWITR